MDLPIALKEGALQEWFEKPIIGTSYELYYGGVSAVPYRRPSSEIVFYGTLLWVPNDPEVDPDHFTRYDTNPGHLKILDEETGAEFEIYEIYSVVIERRHLHVDGFSGRRTDSLDRFSGLQEVTWILEIGG